MVELCRQLLRLLSAGRSMLRLLPRHAAHDQRTDSRRSYAEREGLKTRSKAFRHLVERGLEAVQAGAVVAAKRAKGKR